MIRALIAMALVAVASAAHARPWTAWLDDARERIGAVHGEDDAPRRTPLNWHPRRVADFDFGAPVLDAAALDVVPDGTDELVILTTRELITISGVASDRFELVDRVALSAPDASIAVRDAVGFLSVVHAQGTTELWVRTSDHQRGERFAPADGTLQRVGSFDGVPVCSLEHGRWVEGRGVMYPLVRGNPRFHAGRCIRSYRGADGARVDGRVVLSSNRTLSMVGWACHAGTCRRLAGARPLPDAGRAFAAGDLDGDGRLDVVTTSDAIAGAPDRLTVRSWRGSASTLTYSKKTNLGVVAAVIGDFAERTGLELVSLHRKFRERRVEIWTWNE